MDDRELGDRGIYLEIINSESSPVTVSYNGQVDTIANSGFRYLYDTIHKRWIPVEWSRWSSSIHFEPYRLPSLYLTW